MSDWDTGWNTHKKHGASLSLDTLRDRIIQSVEKELRLQPIRSVDTSAMVKMEIRVATSVKMAIEHLQAKLGNSNDPASRNAVLQHLVFIGIEVIALLIKDEDESIMRIINRSRIDEINARITQREQDKMEVDRATVTYYSASDNDDRKVALDVLRSYANSSSESVSTKAKEALQRIGE